MKIFGHYIVEDTPELKDYLREKEKRRRRAMIKSCAGGFDDPFSLPLPCIRFGDVLASKREVTRKNLRLHREFAQRGECHFFNGKKYCYHTGREIIATA